MLITFLREFWQNQRIRNQHQLMRFLYPPDKSGLPTIFSMSYYHFFANFEPNAKKLAQINAILLEHELKENYVLYFRVRTFKLLKLFRPE
jgi:hypothetical protein